MDIASQADVVLFSKRILDAQIGKMKYLSEFTNTEVTVIGNQLVFESANEEEIKLIINKSTLTVMDIVELIQQSKDYISLIEKEMVGKKTLEGIIKCDTERNFIRHLQNLRISL